MNKLRSLSIALASLMLLTACETAVSSGPVLRDYSPAYQKMLAERMAELPDGDIIVETITDYKILRDQVRIQNEALN